MSVAFVNNDIPGSFEPFPKPTTRQVNKKFDSTAGTDKEWYRGFLYAYDPDDTTKTAYVVAEADAVGPFYVSVGYALKQLANIPSNYIMYDGNFAILGALQSDPLALGLYEGVVTTYLDGIVQPGQKVMPADGSTTHGGSPEVLGHFKAWDGSDPKAVAGIYTGLIGQSGGRWTRTATTNVIGTLGKVHVTPGAGA
jgi:hypothetical protein